MTPCSLCGRDVPGSAAICEVCGHPRELAAAATTTDAVQPLEAGDIVAPILEVPDDVLETVTASDQDAGLPGPLLSGAPPDARFSRREFAMMLLALVGTGTITTIFLMSRGVASPEAAAAVPALATPRPSTPPAMPAVTLSTRTTKWTTASSGRWLGNARRSFAAELPAEAPVAIWMRSVRPVLVVRCMTGAPEVFVFTDSAARIEPRTADHTVRLSFDDQPEATERWPDSADHDALFAPDGPALLSRLTQARVLRFGFTPHNAPAVTAEFHVGGLANALARTRECSGRK